MCIHIYDRHKVMEITNFIRISFRTTATSLEVLGDETDAPLVMGKKCLYNYSSNQVNTAAEHGQQRNSTMAVCKL